LDPHTTQAPPLVPQALGAVPGRHWPEVSQQPPGQVQVGELWQAWLAHE
jgi:hypothetical protein